LILQRDDHSVLYGYRLIDPYARKWSLIGGRFLYGESLMERARRIAGEYGMGFRDLYLVGVFPVKFNARSDVSIAVATSESFRTPWWMERSFLVLPGGGHRLETSEKTTGRRC